MVGKVLKHFLLFRECVAKDRNALLDERVISGSRAAAVCDGNDDSVRV